jgi:uncharacterized membrane protein YtjA (UPF0391 family)
MRYLKLAWDIVYYTVALTTAVVGFVQVYNQDMTEAAATYSILAVLILFNREANDR